MGRTSKAKVEIIDPKDCLKALSRAIAVFSEYKAAYPKLKSENEGKTNIHDSYIGLFSKVTAAVNEFEAETKCTEKERVQDFYKALGFMIDTNNIDDRMALVAEFKNCVKNGDIEVLVSADGFSFGGGIEADIQVAAEEFAKRFLPAAAPQYFSNGEKIERFPARVVSGGA